MLTDIGEAIVRARKRVDLTQHALGGMVGKNQRTIASYESGAVDIPLSVLLQIAEATDTDVVELLGRPQTFRDETLETIATNGNYKLAYLLIPREAV